jgi:transposase InsO family protein
MRSGLPAPSSCRANIRKVPLPSSYGRSLVRQPGVTAERVMTENGSVYRSGARGKARAEAALKHKQTRPCMPKANCKAERFIQSNLCEKAYLRSSTSSAEPGAAIRPGLHDCNSTRPRTALDGKPPFTRPNRENLLGSYS